MGRHGDALFQVVAVAHESSRSSTNLKVVGLISGSSCHVKVSSGKILAPSYSRMSSSEYEYLIENTLM